MNNNIIEEESLILRMVMTKQAINGVWIFSDIDLIQKIKVFARKIKNLASIFPISKDMNKEDFSIHMCAIFYTALNSLVEKRLVTKLTAEEVVLKIENKQIEANFFVQWYKVDTNCLISSY